MFVNGNISYDMNRIIISCTGRLLDNALGGPPQPSAPVLQWQESPWAGWCCRIKAQGNSSYLILKTLLWHNFNWLPQIKANSAINVFIMPCAVAVLWKSKINKNKMVTYVCIIWKAKCMQGICHCRINRAQDVLFVGHLIVCLIIWILK